jgi:ankyrin repeat protein
MDAVNLLLSAGADFESTNPAGNTALMELVCYDHRDMLEVLYKQYVAGVKHDPHALNNVNLIHLAAA